MDQPKEGFVKRATGGHPPRRMRVHVFLGIADKAEGGGGVQTPLPLASRNAGGFKPPPPNPLQAELEGRGSDHPFPGVLSSRNFST